MGQRERERAGGVLGVLVLPASLRGGDGAEGTDKVLRAPWLLLPAPAGAWMPD